MIDPTQEQLADPAFKAWLAKLDALPLAIEHYGERCSETTGAECWWWYWRDDYSPESAVAEDLSYD